MLEKEPSGLPLEADVTPKTSEAAAGGAFPTGNSSLVPTAESPSNAKRCTLQFLIAALRKSK
jgi:hypothetical protein